MLRRRETERLVAEVRRSLEAGDLKPALGRLHEALRIDPCHRRALGYQLLLDITAARLSGEELDAAIEQARVAIEGLSSGHPQHAAEARENLKKLFPQNVVANRFSAVCHTREVSW